MLGRISKTNSYIIMYSEVGQNLFRCYPLVWITYYCTFHLEKWQHLLWKQKSRNENEVRSQSQICLHSKCLHWGQLVGCVKGLRHQPQLLRSNGEGTGKHGTLWGRVWTMSSNQIVTLSQEPYGLVKIHFSFLSGPSGWCYTPFPQDPLVGATHPFHWERYVYFVH